MTLYGVIKLAEPSVKHKLLVPVHDIIWCEQIG